MSEEWSWYHVPKLFSPAFLTLQTCFKSCLMPFFYYLYNVFLTNKHWIQSTPTTKNSQSTLSAQQTLFADFWLKPGQIPLKKWEERDKLHSLMCVISTWAIELCNKQFSSGFVHLPVRQFRLSWDTQSVLCSLGSKEEVSVTACVFCSWKTCVCFFVFLTILTIFWSTVQHRYITCNYRKKMHHCFAKTLLDWSQRLLTQGALHPLPTSNLK